MKESRYIFLLGIVIGLFLGCLINITDDSTIDFNSAMTIILGIAILLIVIILNHCGKHKN